MRDMVYIVVRNRKPFITEVIHLSPSGADSEAERLAQKEGDTFLVFQLVAAAGPPPTSVRLLTADEISQLPCPLEVRP